MFRKIQINGIKKCLEFSIFSHQSFFIETLESIFEIKKLKKQNSIHLRHLSLRLKIFIFNIKNSIKVPYFLQRSPREDKTRLVSSSLRSQKLHPLHFVISQCCPEKDEGRHVTYPIIVAHRHGGGRSECFDRGWVRRVAHSCL